MRWDGNAFLVSPQTGAQIATYPDDEDVGDHEDSIASARFVAGRPEVLTAREDGIARRWPIAGGPPLKTYAWPGAAAALVFEPAGERVVAGMEGETRIIALTGEVAQRFPTADGTAIAIAVSPDGLSQLVGTEDGEVRMWRDGREAMLLRGHTGPVSAVAFSADGKLALSGSYDGTAKLWRVDLSEPQEIDISARRPYPEMSRGFNVSAFSRDGGRVVAGYQDASVIVYSSADGKVLADIKLEYPGEDRRIVVASFTPDGKAVLIGSRRKLGLYPSEGGAPVAAYSLGGFDAEILSAQISPDGKLVAAGAKYGGVFLWPIEGGEPSIVFVAHDKKDVTSVAWSPDGKRFATSSDDRSVKIWRAGSDVALADFKDGPPGMYPSRNGRVVFSPDGSMLMSVAWAQATAWPTKAGQAGNEARGGGAAFAISRTGVFRIMFDDAGHYALAGSSPDKLTLWPLDGRDPVGESRITEGTIGVDSMAMAPDGQGVLYVSQLGYLRRWQTGRLPFAPAREQVKLACDALKTMGATEFSVADFQRFPILDRNAPHSCAKVWGADPQAKAKLEGGAAKAQ